MNAINFVPLDAKVCGVEIAECVREVKAERMAALQWVAANPNRPACCMPSELWAGGGELCDLDGLINGYGLTPTGAAALAWLEAEAGPPLCEARYAASEVPDADLRPRKGDRVRSESGVAVVLAASVDPRIVHIRRNGGGETRIYVTWCTLLARGQPSGCPHCAVAEGALHTDGCARPLAVGERVVYRGSRRGRVTKEATPGCPAVTVLFDNGSAAVVGVLSVLRRLTAAERDEPAERERDPYQRFGHKGASYMIGVDLAAGPDVAVLTTRERHADGSVTMVQAGAEPKPAVDPYDEGWIVVDNVAHRDSGHDPEMLCGYRDEGDEVDDDGSVWYEARPDGFPVCDECGHRYAAGQVRLTASLIACGLACWLCSVPFRGHTDVRKGTRGTAHATCWRERNGVPA